MTKALSAGELASYQAAVPLGFDVESVGDCGVAAVGTVAPGAIELQICEVVFGPPAQAGATGWMKPAVALPAVATAMAKPLQSARRCDR